MAALGELIVLMIYVILGLPCIAFIVLTFTSRKSIKPWTFIGSILFGFLFFNFKSCQDANYQKNQLSRVGTYYLTSYPNCDSCYIELKEDMTYVVVSKGKIIEQSNWHYESGGDYWITYLDNDNHQLGSGVYAYDSSMHKYGDDN